MTQLEKSAVFYVEKIGWSIFPVMPLEKRPLGTLVPRGVKDATDNIEIIRSWWVSNPMANIGLPCGSINNILVIDIDGPNGEEALNSLEKTHGELPRTIEQTTGKGRHLLFEMPSGRIKNRVKIDTDIDIRSDGGYIVITPSIHPSGDQYQWKEGHKPYQIKPATLPDAWIEYLCESKDCTNSVKTLPVFIPKSSTGSTRWGEKRLVENCHDVSKTGQGGRNNALNLAAYRVGQAIASGHIDDQSARSELLKAALSCGLKETESIKTIDSGIKNGLSTPVMPKEETKYRMDPVGPNKEFDERRKSIQATEGLDKIDAEKRTL